MKAHFELHIEQGPRLETQQQKIGIVHGVQAYRWHTIHVKGRDCHTGTTEFANRSDAELTASKLILHSHRLATQYSCLASTGILTLFPGSMNSKFVCDSNLSRVNSRSFAQCLLGPFILDASLVTELSSSTNYADIQM